MDHDPQSLFDRQEPRRDTWAISFADLTSLLLAFFVLMFSMSAVRMADYAAVIKPLGENFNPAEARLRDQPAKADDKPTIDPVMGDDLPYLATVLAEQFTKYPVLADARVRFIHDQVAISIPTDALFKAGGVKISDAEVFAALSSFSVMLRQMKNDITVVGYTDPSPLADKTYESQWELSLSRAVVIAEILKQNGYRKPIAAYAYGEERFGTQLDDVPMALRARLARRIDIVIREESEPSG